MSSNNKTNLINELENSQKSQSKLVLKACPQGNEPVDSFLTTPWADLSSSDVCNKTVAMCLLSAWIENLVVIFSKIKARHNHHCFDMFNDIIHPLIVCAYLYFQ